jgi:hypothetical protein
VIAAAPGSVTLYDQNDEDNGMAVPSENYGHGFDSFDSSGADDFTVPAGHAWKIRQVEVSGIYGQGTTFPAESEDIYFYKDRSGLPGDPIAQCDNLGGVDNQGSFSITLSKSCKVNLKGGKRYWVSVVANENNACCTLWFWETRDVRSGKSAAWENPHNGYGTGCTMWDVMISCIGDYGEGPDFMFSLKGTDVVR